MDKSGPRVGATPSFPLQVTRELLVRSSTPTFSPVKRIPKLPSIRLLASKKRSERGRDCTPSTSSGSIHSGISAEPSCRSVSLHNSLWYAPFVTAQTWAVTDGDTGSFLWGSFESQPREVASLTKIATCLLCLRRLTIDSSLSPSSLVPVSRFAASMLGTSARLREGDELYLMDALYAMMLPSGNDAAYALAEFVGRRIKEEKRDQGSPVSCFVRSLNEIAQELGLTATQFANPHGLPNAKNRSSARDIGLLAFTALQLPLFSQIVSTPTYTCYISQQSDVFAYRKMRWVNTNRLLGQGWEGVKTGVTGSAGPCLCACRKRKGGRVIVTVLGVRTMDKRWEEVEKLAKWAEGKRGNQEQGSKEIVSRN